MKHWRIENGVENHISRMDLELSEDVLCWLSKLSLLSGIPFSCLAADERLLPEESIRFFYLNQQWTDSLVDGALSIGRNTQAEIRADSFFRDRRNAEILLQHHQHRYNRMHENHRRGLKNAVGREDMITGILLRSTLVSSWRGLEIKGYRKKQELTILRMERLSDDILICIFDQEAECVEILEPSEELHFGTRTDERILEVRNIAEGKEGELTGKKVSVPVDINGKIKVKELADSLKKSLDSMGKENLEITSAELAFEMLSAAGQGIFQNRQADGRAE